MVSAIKIIYKMYLEFSDTPEIIDLASSVYSVPIQIGMAGVEHSRADRNDAMLLLKAVIRK